MFAAAHAERNLSRAPKCVLEKCWFKDIEVKNMHSRLPAPMFCAHTWDMQIRRLSVILFAVCFLIPVYASAQGVQNSDRPSLDSLFAALKKTQDAAKAFVIQDEIWRRWMFSDQEDLNFLMRQGAAALKKKDYALALESFDAFVVLAPTRAEGWNKRATLHYMMGDYKRSIEDVKRTLALEPRHFGALAGLGLIYEALGDKKAALTAFHAGLKVNPHMTAIKEKAKRIAQEIKDSNI
jgi:tetratricopeptide (TPR) repeat protein